MVALLLSLLATPVPPGALLDRPGDAAVVARAEPAAEPWRAVGEYAGALAAFTAFNGAASLLLSNAHVNVAPGGNVSVGGAVPSLAGAGVLIALSPLAGAITSWVIGKGSDDWDPSLGWATLGAYGSSLAALGIGYALAAGNVSRDSATAADAALYLAVPLGTVLVQNATKSPRK